MSTNIVSADLVGLGQEAVGKIATGIMTGASAPHCQLLASAFYEALKLELRHTPRSDFRKVGALAAAIDQCHRAASASISPGLILAELRAAVAILASARRQRPGSAGFSEFRPQLRVIQGGRA